MNDSNYNIDELIVRFLDGSINETEREILFRNIRKDPEIKKKFNNMIRIWNVSRLEEQTIDPAGAYLKFQQRMEIPQESGHPNKFFRYIKYTIPVAASIALLLIFIFLLKPGNRESQDQLSLFTELKMPSGAKGSINLSDHSTVWVNTNSTLYYPEKFTGNTRTVKITGEAYFEIAKDASKPFIVDLGNEKIKVLGTSFNVRNNTGLTEVALLTGKVCIETVSDGKKIYLKPNEKWVYSKHTGKGSIETTDAGIYNIWIKDRLVFDNANLSYVITCLERWYGIRIQYTQQVNKIEGISLSVRNESIEEVLKGIQQIAPIKYTILKNKIATDK